MNTQTLSLLELTHEYLKMAKLYAPPMAYGNTSLDEVISKTETAIAAERSKEQASVGTILHIGDGKATLTAAILPLLKEQAKPQRIEVYRGDTLIGHVASSKETAGTWGDKPKQEPATVVVALDDVFKHAEVNHLPVGTKLYTSPQPLKPQQVLWFTKSTDGKEIYASPQAGVGICFSAAADLVCWVHENIGSNPHFNFAELEDLATSMKRAATK